jgi:hypothetical protein
MARVACALILTGWLFAAVSCAPPVVATAGVSAVQAGTMAFVNGDIEVAFRVPLNDAFAAGHRALQRLEVPVEKESLYEGIAFLTGKLADGRRIKIVLVKQSAVLTKFSLRVGTFGDQPVSRLVMAQIQEELAPRWASPPEAP